MFRRVNSLIAGLVFLFSRFISLFARLVDLGQPSDQLLGLQRVVDDDDVGAPPGQHPAHRGGDATALRRRLEFALRTDGAR
jgi:hypothetical protein